MHNVQSPIALGWDCLETARLLLVRQPAKWRGRLIIG